MPKLKSEIAKPVPYTIAEYPSKNKNKIKVTTGPIKK